MTKILEIYIHGEGFRDPKMIRVPEESTIQDLARAAGIQLNGTEEVFVMAEDEDDPKTPDDTLAKGGVEHRHHVHCHRCKRVETIVMYNGIRKEREFAPSSRIKKVLNWALKEYHLHGHDAEDKVLFLPDGTTLSEDAHIGSYTSFPECRITLALGVPVVVNG
jgi:hypothetical protein